MSVTDVLRESMRPCISDDWLTIPKSEFKTLADRIDAEYERMYEALTIGMEPMTEENMAQDGWVKLPVDVDGVPIHVGDAVVDVDCPKEPHLVDELRLDGMTWRIFMDNFMLLPSKCRHAADSWERIIEDAVKNGMYDHDNERIQQKLVERCKRLAGES